MLEFNEHKHVYTWEGRIVPSVTQIINEWIKVDIWGTDYYINTFTGAVVDAERFETAAKFGTAVHKAAKLILTGQGVNWLTLANPLVKPLEQLMQWISYYGIKPVLVEEPLYSKNYDYAGTPDIFHTMRGDSYLHCTDIKTGEYGMVGPQTAAYAKQYIEVKKYRGKIKRHVLFLPKSGDSYRFNELTKRSDWPFFESRLLQQRVLKAA